MRTAFRYFLLSLALTNWSVWAQEKALKARHVEGQILAKIDPHQKTNLAALLKEKGIRKLRDLELEAGHFLLMQTDGGEKKLAQALAEVESLPGVIYAEPNYIYQAEGQMAPSDPSFDLLWGLENQGNNEPNANGGRSDVVGVKGADAQLAHAWNITRGSHQIRIAVIDTGIDYTHPDLKDNIWTNTAEANGKAGVDDDQNGYVDDIHGYNFADNRADPKDGHGHGTHCAGTIGAKHNNGVGVAGMMDEVSLIAVKFLADNGQGTTEGAIKAVDYATKLNVDIMSNSWGGGGQSKALEDAIAAASKRGIVFVAAAGNDGLNNDDYPHYPSSYNQPNVIAVAAHTAQDKLASFSNWGRKSVHVAAPGRNILSTVPKEKYAVYSGTSMATPHVSGAIGLLFALEGRMPLDQVKDRLLMTSAPVGAYRGKVMKGGRLATANLLTDTRPVRVEPVEGAWKSFKLPLPFETAHPYAADTNIEKSFTVPGAQFIRAVVKKYELEDKWDFLYILDGSRSLLESVSGSGANRVTEYVAGESITLNFKSDQVVHKWGFIIEELQYQ